MSLASSPRAPVSTPPPRALAPKRVAKDLSKLLTVEERVRLVEKWEAHVAAYQQSLGSSDPGMVPNQQHFETVNGLGRNVLTNAIKSIEKMRQIPEKSHGIRLQAREDIRPFYPVEKVLNKVVIVLRQEKVTVDVWLLRLLAMVIYEHLLQKFGPMVFSRPMFSYGWAANFMRIWGFSHTKLQGEADSIPLSAIKVEVEVLRQTISGYNLDDVYNAD
ncbi:hypothetical protein BGZ74_010298, partial [Mortierella antarctica]